MSSTRIPASVWACVLESSPRKIAPRSTPGWTNSPANRSDAPSFCKPHCWNLPRRATPRSVLLQFKRRSAMTGSLDNGLFLLLLRVYGALLILGPILLRLQFRFKARLNPQVVPVESLPPDVQQFMAPRVKSIAGLGFEPVAYVNVGNITTNTGSFMALLSNPRTLEWADVSVVKSTKKMAGYMEFITRCSNDAQVDTNTSSTAPVMSPSSTYHVFRFPQVKDAFTLYRAHRMLVQENTGGSKPELPPPGQELSELKRRLERYGPRQQEHGYVY